MSLIYVSIVITYYMYLFDQLNELNWIAHVRPLSIIISMFARAVIIYLQYSLIAAPPIKTLFTFVSLHLLICDRRKRRNWEG